MAAPANNPFGAPPAQVLHNPFSNSASGQPASAFGTPVQNPFGSPAPTSFGKPPNNPFGAPAPGSRPSSAGNRFGAPTGQTSVFSPPAASAPHSAATSRQPSPASHNPFGKPPAQAPAANFFAPAQQSAGGSAPNPSPFGFQAQPTVLGTVDQNAMARQSKFPGGKAAAPNNNGFGGRGQKRNLQGATPFANSKAPAKQLNARAAEASSKFQPGGRNKKPERQERYQPAPRVNGAKAGPTREPTERTKQLSTFAFNYANKLYGQLKKEKINPPQPVADPGDPNKRGAVDNLKEAYKKYRTRVYASLRKADLIDDPDKRRKLEDALPFKGICEDMCPEFEQVSRIAEFDVRLEEKETRTNGPPWPDMSRMVKKFGRSAAGQDAPLPMDVRSVDALRRTTDYLFNDLLQSESNLPAMHNFLWDRTRAVRKDFTFHSQKSGEEMKDMVYCFETITRFHATALHLLSKKGVANEDFDQKQEIEQLGRTILSLMEAYDVCRDKRVPCENEAEFRAYYLLLNAGDPTITKRIPTWGKEYWFESEEVQTALSLIQVMDDVREPKGPIKPRRPTTLSDTSFANYFSIVEDPRVSYTMACIAEIHFTTVRQGVLRNLVRGYARHRDAPRTITASDLNAMLKFDTDEEAVEFAELHDFEFSTWVPQGKNPVSEPYLLLNNRKKYVPSPRVRQSYSGKMVERKRTTQSLPFVIYNTVYEEPTENPPSAQSSPDSLFVNQASFGEQSTATSTNLQPATASPFASPSPSPSPFGFAPKDVSPGGPSATTGSAFAKQPSGAISNPFGAPSQPASATTPASQPSTSSTPSPFGTPSQPLAAQPGTSPFTFSAQPPAASTTATTSAPKFGFPPAQPAQPEQTTASPLTTSKSSETASPFSFLQNFGSTPAPSVSQTAQQAPATPAFPSAPSLIGSSAPKPATPFASSEDASSTQTKPAEPVASFSKPSPAQPGTSPFSPAALPKPTEQQPPAAPAVPSISVTPPSVRGQPTTQSAQPTPIPASSQIPKQSPLPSAPTSRTPSLFTSSAPAAAVPPKPQQPLKRDLMGDFTKWYVKGDDGLMEQFTESTLHNMLWAIFDKYQRQEAERKRKEEDDESWRVAREHQTYRLQVKYLYRWRNIARALATKRILRSGKEKMRQYREQQRIIQKQLQEEQEKAERESRRAAKRQLLEDSLRFSLLAASPRPRRPSVAYSADHNPEEQLLASGIFAGLRDDPRDVARRVVKEAVANTNDDGGWGSVTTSRSFRYPYPESELELEPARADSPDDTSNVGRREGWKTRSLREKFGIGGGSDQSLRRSLSASGNSVRNHSNNYKSALLNGYTPPFSASSQFRQSLPPNRSTNFSSTRKRSAEEESDDEPGAKRLITKPSGLAKSRHWDLRARGFVPTSDGGWVPEAIATPSGVAKEVAADLPPTSGLGLGYGYAQADDTSVDAGAGADADADAVDDTVSVSASETNHHHHHDRHRRASSSASSMSVSMSQSTDDLRARLERIRKARAFGAQGQGQGHAKGHGHGARHSVDLPSSSTIGTGLGATLLGSVSPPHPPFMPPAPPRRKAGDKKNSGDGVGAKRKRGVVDLDDAPNGVGSGGDGIGGRELSSPGVNKRANVGGSDGGAAVPGREETSAMVENTKRMLRELREFMDQLDGPGQGRDQVLLQG